MSFIFSYNSMIGCVICVLIFDKKIEVMIIRPKVSETNGITNWFYIVVETASRTTSIFLSIID